MYFDPAILKDKQLLSQFAIKTVYKNKQALFAEIQDTMDALALQDMDEYGLGVFTHENRKKIRLIYQGYLRLRRNEKTKDYDEALSLLGQDGSSLAVTDIKDTKHFASAIQHAPDKKTLDEDYWFENDDVKNNAATANVSATTVRCGDGIPITLVQSDDSFPANTQLLMDYDEKYWQDHCLKKKGKGPILFDKKTGEPLQGEYLGPLHIGYEQDGRFISAKFPGKIRHDLLQRLEGTLYTNATCSIPLPGGGEIKFKSTQELFAVLRDPSAYVLEVDPKDFILGNAKVQTESISKLPSTKITGAQLRSAALDKDKTAKEFKSLLENNKHLIDDTAVNGDTALHSAVMRFILGKKANNVSWCKEAEEKILALVNAGAKLDAGTKKTPFKLALESELFPKELLSKLLPSNMNLEEELKKTETKKEQNKTLNL